PYTTLFRSRNPRSVTWGFHLERVKGIEPALSAWEAEVLPLNYTRVRVRGACALEAGTSGTPRRPGNDDQHTPCRPAVRTGGDRAEPLQCPGPTPPRRTSRAPRRTGRTPPRRTGRDHLSPPGGGQLGWAPCC